MIAKYGLIVAVTAAYVVQAGICFTIGAKPQGVIVLGYALANCGLIWSM